MSMVILNFMVSGKMHGSKWPTTLFNLSDPLHLFSPTEKTLLFSVEVQLLLCSTCQRNSGVESEVQLIRTATIIMLFNLKMEILWFLAGRANSELIYALGTKEHCSVKGKTRL